MLRHLSFVDFCADVKLVGGRRPSEGLLYVKDGPQNWGTLCDDNWDHRDAEVVCKNLGYSGYNIY